MKLYAKVALGMSLVGSFIFTSPTVKITITNNLPYAVIIKEPKWESTGMLTRDYKTVATLQQGKTSELIIPSINHGRAVLEIFKDNDELISNITFLQQQINAQNNRVNVWVTDSRLAGSESVWWNEEVSSNIKNFDIRINLKQDEKEFLNRSSELSVDYK
ncbi:MAG: hypothetical protein ACOYT8_01390 [Candidatus Dependentiae bacterium]